MDILLITFVYNEKPYIEDMIKYYRTQGVNIYIIDNMSNDGTYEWLVKNNVECSRFDTKESFNLNKLQKELTRIVTIKKPDWVVYASADLYYVFDKTIKETIEEANIKGYNQLNVKCYGALNTGEKFKTPLQETYKYGVVWKTLKMNAKYVDGFKMRGDDIFINKSNPVNVGGIMINYGGCKPMREQKEKLKRRKKAWTEGLNPRTGKHFLKYEKIDWLWNKSFCINLFESEDKKYFEKLLNESK